MTRKLPKSEVNYRPATGRDRCGNCSMYRPRLHRDGKPSSCTLVSGEINPNDTCDRYEKEAA